MTSTSALQALRPSQGVHSAAPTRSSSRASRLDVPGPGHPARFRSLISTAGLLARGSPPASAFPGVPQWHSVEARRLQLRGQLRIKNQRFAPHSLFALPVAEKRPSAWKLRAGGLRCQRGQTGGGQIGFALGRSSFIVAPSSVFDENRERECGKDVTFEAAAAPATVCG
jgi:hypothetical protein